MEMSTSGGGVLVVPPLPTRAPRPLAGCTDMRTHAHAMHHMYDTLSLAGGRVGSEEEKEREKSQHDKRSDLTLDR